MLQPKNLKKTQGHFWRSFTWMDFFVGSLIIIVSVLIGYTVLPPHIPRTWSLVLSIFVAIAFSPFLIKSNKYNCRVYVLLFRAIKYLFSVKKFDKKHANPKLLIPYSSIFENKFVKTKPLKTGTKYLAILKFQGKSPWNEDNEDKDAFLNKFVQIIDTTDKHITFIRTKELIDYTNNFYNLKQNFDAKLKNLNKKNVSKEIKDNYLSYYENLYNDFDILDTRLLVDTYYVVLYDKSISELKKNLNNITAIFNSMDIDTTLVEGLHLIKFLAKLNNKEIDEEKANQYLEQQINSQRQALIKNKEVDFIEKQTFKTKVKEFFKFLKEEFKKLFSKKKNKQIANKNNQVKVEKKENKLLALDDILANDHVIFKHNYFIQDSKYCSIHTISELPLDLQEGWAIDIFANNSTIVWNLGIFNEATQATLLDKTGKKISDNSSIIKSRYYQKAGGLQLEALEYLENQLQVNKNALTNSSLMIINCADSLKELRKIEQKNFLNVKRAKLNINPIPFKQFEGMAQSCLITTNNLNEAIPMSSYNVAYGWPFENETNNDGNSFILGETTATGEPIIFNQFYKNSSRRVNYNMFTVGSSGKGKSTDVKKAILGHLATNNKVYIIDPQNEYAKLGKKFGGTLIDLGLGYKTIINPLQVQIQLFDDQDDQSIKLIINKHLEWLETFFKLINPDWVQDNFVFLMSFVRNLYEKLGIYNLTSYQELAEFDYPIMSDLIAELRKYQFKDEFEKIRKQNLLANIIDRLSFDFEYNGKYEYVYNGKTNIDLSNDFIIFNTQKLFDTSASSGKVGLFVLLSFIQNQIFNNVIENPNINTVLVIDELHMYIDPNNSATLDFVYTMTKTVRKFNAGMILCTQNPSDFLGSALITKKAEAILQNCQYAKFFGLKQKDLEAVMDMFKSSGGLNGSHQRFLADSEIGNLIFSLHMYSKIKSSIYYNDFEKELFFEKGYIGDKN
ncbi:Mbov_0397 family ICE element conjugal transfer ATPase [Metamycoplasma alkalescens]|uniref:Type IV secretory pathway VirB4 component n=2 Tax=Metamycoplasma alkalescens TaxID=45363 RepID=A0A318U6G2_9BACT|nr:conjugal transfer protein TraE [Metamycoplasma alkalescens]PYF43138.1 type IV secretory pathway VirB4 component [Metamycoplasma alkalescens]